jgi:hypothetical protein
VLIIGTPLILATEVVKTTPLAGVFERGGQPGDQCLHLLGRQLALFDTDDLVLVIGVGRMPFAVDEVGRDLDLSLGQGRLGLLIRPGRHDRFGQCGVG